MCNSHRRNRTRVTTKTGGILFSRPNDGSLSTAIICNIGRSRLHTRRHVISGTSYAAGYVVPIVGLLSSTCNVRSNAIAAVRSTVRSRRIVSTCRPSLHHAQTTDRSVVPISAGLTTNVAQFFPRFGSHFRTVTMHIPAVGIATVSLDIAIGGPMGTGRIGLLLRGTTRNTFRNVISCARLPLISMSFGRSPRDTVISNARAQIDNTRLVGALI